MTDRKAAVTRALVQTAIIKALEQDHEQTRAELAELFTDVGEREVGMLLDHRLGTVSLDAGYETWRVVDEELFLKWVKTFYPHEVVESVRPSFKDAVLARCKRDGGFVDENGEVEIPDGILPRKGAPRLVERTDKHAGWVVRQWLGGEVAERLGLEAS